jgi:hypothetical protein
LTPAGQKRRFATWFFIAVLPADASVQVDGEEMVDAVWINPRHAVSEHKAGRLRLPPPTVVSLLDVAQSETTAEAIAKADERRAPYFYPKILAEDPENVVMLYPGDAGYDGSDELAPGERHRARWVDGVIDYERSFEFASR